MPYVKKSVRKELLTREPKTSGELNYVITKKVLDYLKWKGYCYDNFNEVIGALECAKIELYRRKIAKYEDVKIEENGDVY